MPHAQTDEKSLGLLKRKHKFGSDTRAVTPVIAFILLFGILVVAFAGYQATSVPDQNAQTEFTHSQEVRDDLVDMRSGILQAGEGDRQFKSVKLGTQYRDRLFAVNPSPANGILSTSSSETLRLSSNSIDSSIETRFLLYEPQYNQLPNDPVYYDTSALYLDPLGNNNTVLFEDQAIIDDDEVQLVALQNLHTTQGVQKSSIDLRPGAGESINVTDRLLANNEFEFTVEIPTRLDEEDWEGMIDGQFDEDDAWRVDETTNPNTLELDFNESRTLHLNTVGVGGVPSAPDGLLTAMLVKASVSGLDTSVSGGQEQIFTFTVGKDGIEGDKDVKIDLTDPVESDEITYPGEETDPVIVEGEGDVSYTRGDDDVILYTAPEEGLSEGDEIVIELPNIDAEGATSGEEYTVDFIDPSGGFLQDTFLTFDFGSPPKASLPKLDIAEQGSSAIISEGENKDIAVDITNIGSDGEFDLALEIDGTVEEEIGGIELDAGEEQTEIFEGVTGDILAGEYDVTVRAFFDGDEQDSISGELVVEEPPDPEINMRVDDLTDIDTDNVRFYVSYDIDAIHDEVEITAESNSESTSVTASAGRGGELLDSIESNADQEFNVTVTAFEEDEEEPVIERTITTNSNTLNPAENDDLERSGSPAFEEYNVEDQSDLQSDRVEYQYNYEINKNGGFSEVYGLAISVEGSGGSAYEVSQSPSESDFEVSANYGAGTEYKIGMLIVDETGAVAQSELQTDVADGELNRVELSDLDINGGGENGRALQEEEFDVSVDVSGNIRSGDDTILLQIVSQDGEEKESEEVSIQEGGTITVDELNIDDPGEYNIIVQARNGNGARLDEVSGEVTVLEVLYPDRIVEGQEFVENFNNMKEANSQVAEFSGSPPSAFSVDVLTEDVPAGQYTFELGTGNIDLQGGGGDGIEITIEDEDRNELGKRTLDEENANEIVSVDIGEIDPDQDIFVNYVGDRQNDEIDIDFQRFIKEN